MRWLFPIFTVLIAIFLQTYEDRLPSGVRVGAVVLSAAMILLFVLTSAPTAVNPFTVYAMLALMAGLGWIWLRALTELGPAGVLALTLGLLALTTYLTLTRGDALRRRREASGLCGRCGYDLRASPDVCPECGAAVGEDLKRRRRIADELAAARAQRDAG